MLVCDISDIWQWVGGWVWYGCGAGAGGADACACACVRVCVEDGFLITSPSFEPDQRAIGGDAVYIY